MIAPICMTANFGSVCGKRRDWDRGSHARGAKEAVFVEIKSQSNGVYQRKFEVYQAGEKGDHTDQRCAECTVPFR